MNLSNGGGGWLQRLRENETLRKLSRGRPDYIIFGAPVAAVVLIALVAGIAVAMSGGGGGGAQAKAKTPADASATKPAGTPTLASAGLKTPIAISPGDVLAPGDLAARGTGVPGRGEFTGSRLVIPK